MLHSVALNGCWKKLYLKANDFQDFPNHEHNVRMLTHNVPGFPNLEEANIQQVLDLHSAELIEVSLFLFYVEHPIVMQIHNV
jgi:hypothetical protein